MTSSRSWLRLPVRALRAVALAALVLLAVPRRAHADNVDQLIQQLQSSSDYKVRLSAALNLAKLNNKRAIPAFIKALGDSDKTVRGAAAAALGKLVDSTTSPKLRSDALAKLKGLVDGDANSFVQKQAQKAYDGIKQLDGKGGGGTAAPSGSLFIEVSDMAAETDGADKMKALMRKTTLTTIAKKAPSVSTAWPTGKSPTKGQLAAAKIQAFYVHGTLNELKTAAKSGSTIVSCKVNMLIGTYPDKSMFGFANGGASVQAGTSAKDIEYAKEDCITAVVEDLVGKKIIPAIESRKSE
jgi:HEAT repeat protein